MRSTSLITISLPPAMAQKTQKAAKKQNMTRSELFRAAIDQYLYELEQREARLAWEIKDTREAITAYNKAKREGKLKTLKGSLSDLMD